MSFEYIIFNIIVISGPLSLSFDKKVAFFKHWKNVFLSIFIVGAVFIIWDIIVTGRHWWFNELYTSQFLIFGLPVGEWLFFITVPYATLFLWEVFKAYTAPSKTRNSQNIFLLTVTLIPLSIYFFYTGMEYSALSLLVFGLIGPLHKFFGLNVLHSKPAFYLFLIVILLISIFNYYLTARPVVLYSELYKSGLNILTIPVEDYGYGLALVFHCVLVYEKLKERS